jgi:transposase-like protein
MYPIERKTAILEDAKQRILEGSTLAQIASSHGIDTKTLNTWLIALGDEYKELREAWIDNMLIEAKTELDNAQDNFPLARAREQWKAATWYAERRDSQRYGQKTEHKQDLSLSITVNRSLPEAAVIQGDYVAITEELRNDPLKPA